ncbi:MAG: tetratricopeptide repeat protein, partial [Bacteroidota bacterium]
PPPSQAAPSERAARIRGDLDTIVLKALENDPERRYASAQAFAEDVQRHLDGLPVSARRPTAGYRVRTFIRRHPVGVGLSALLAAALLLGMAGTTWQARVASGERDRAQTETAKAEATRDYVLGLFSAANPDSAQGRVVTVREALDLGAARVATDLADQPIVRADVELTIALLYRRLAVYDEAQTHAEAAIALRAEHLGARAPETASARRELATLLIETGDYAESRDAAQQAYDDHIAALGPTDPEALASLNVLGASLSELGEWTEAEGAFEELVARLRTARDSAELSEALLNLGSSRMRQQRFEDGEGPLRESLAIRQDLFGRVHSSTATTMNSLALAIARGRADMDEAEALLVDALDIRRQLYGREHPEVAQMLNNLARFYEENGDLATAEATYDELLPLMQATLGPEHPYTGLVLINYGNLLRQRGRPAEAESFVRQGHAIDRAVHGADHPLAAESETRLAHVMLALGRHGEAQRLLAHAIPILEAAYGKDAPAVQGAHEIRVALP